MTGSRDPLGAVVLVNLGTPAEPTPQSVQHFLKRFLSDRRVVDLPRYLWLPLLRGVILPLRSRRVAKTYQKVWMKEGSPLKVLTERLADKVAKQLDGQFSVYLAMSYSDPSVEAIVAQLIADGHQRVMLLPLYPQYSVTTTAPVFDAYSRAVQQCYFLPELRFIPHYYQYSCYQQALVRSIRLHWQMNGKSERLIFSFHGIPQRYGQLGDPYQQHCEATAMSVARDLELTDTQWDICYQSRFGKEPWLTPYSDDLLGSLAAKGVTSVDVISPAFATDCLETLEEIAIELRDIFITAGGSSFNYISALNDHDDHAKLLAEVILDHAQGW